MRLSTVIKESEAAFFQQYGKSLLPSHYQALNAMKRCRTDDSPLMLAACEKCDERRYVPHSCGHRNCPHCQHHESQQWIERQVQKQLPAEYFMLTFTVPAEFRPLAWQNQREIYSILLKCVWQTVQTFSQNDKQLQGTAGATAVLHTHTRQLSFHPHVHLVMPAAAINQQQRRWRCKQFKNKNSTKSRKAYLFNHKALAKVFRAKLLAAITAAGLRLPDRYPEQWVVDCKHVGTGGTAIIYLGRYLYRGVIAEKDIIACKDGMVTFRYQESRSKQIKTRKVSGAKFLWLLLQHVLPRGFRRSRNYGFLHPNSKRLISLIQILLKMNPARGLAALALMKKRTQLTCPCCAGRMTIIHTKLPPLSRHERLEPT